MTYTRMLMAALAVAAIVFMGGCRIRPRTATLEPRYKQADIDYVADKRVSVASSFQRVFRIQYLNRGTTDSGLLKVQARVENITKGEQILMYRFAWVDKNGMAMNTPTTQWKMTHLQPGEFQFVSGVAPSKKAADFVLSMKQHRATRR